MEAKPICVIYLPEIINVGLRNISWSDCNDMQSDFAKTKPDYYWFVLIDSDAIRIEFKVFYEKDFTEIQYQELKQLIEEKLSNQIE